MRSRQYETLWVVKNLVASLISFSLLVGFSSVAAKQDLLNDEANEITSLPTSKECIMQGQFKQTKTLQGLPTPILSTGIFFRHCKKGLVWKTSEPISESIIIDAKKRAQIFTDGELKQLTSRASKMISRMILNLMNGDSISLNKQFTVSQTSSGDALNLAPKSKRMKRAVQSITIFKGNDEVITAIEIIDRNTNLTQLNFSNLAFFKETNHENACLSFTGLTSEECSALYQAKIDNK